MVRLLCRPNASLRALFDDEILLEKKMLSRTRESSLPAVGSSTHRPTLEEKMLVWETFSCKKLLSSVISPECLVLKESDCENQSMKVRRTGHDLRIETDSSPKDGGDKVCLRNLPSSPDPPCEPRTKAHSPKDLEQMRQMLIKQEVQQLQSTNTDRESPSNGPPTPPTVPRIMPTPRHRKRIFTPPEMPNLSKSGQCQHEPQNVSKVISASQNVGDFRQCSTQFVEKPHGKSCDGAKCKAESTQVVSRKVVPALTAKQLGIAASGESTELSENWKRFEQRKLERKESRELRRKKRADSKALADLNIKFTHEVRICGLMASKLAAPAEFFSQRCDASTCAPQMEGTALRKWI